MRVQTTATAALVSSAQTVAKWPVLLGLLVLLPAGSIALLARFDGLYGQDPFAYFAYATGPLRQSLLELSPLPPFFWPPGYPLLVAVASLPLGTVPLAGQLVSLIAAALVPVFTALLAREVWTTQARKQAGPPDGQWVVPLVAGVAVALNGQLWQSSVVVMSDTAGLAAATLGVWALARYARLRGPAWLLVAAAALAWAVLTRWIYGLVAVPCALYAVYALYALARNSHRVALAHGMGAVLVVGLVLGPVLAPALVVLIVTRGEAAPFTGNLQVYTWHPQNALQREFTVVDGHLTYWLPNGLYYAVAPAHWFFFTPLLAPLLVAGLWDTLRRPTVPALLLLLGWVAVVYGFHAGAPWQNLRFTLAFLPPLGVLVAIGAWQLLRVAGRSMARPMALYFVAGLGLMALGGLSSTLDRIERKNADLATVAWVEAQVPSDARLLAFGLTPTLKHYSQRETLELFELNPTSLTSLLAEGRPTYLLIDVEAVERQWSGLSPSENYRWLRDGPGLASPAQHGPYTLFLAGEGPP